MPSLSRAGAPPCSKRRSATAAPRPPTTLCSSTVATSLRPPAASASTAATSSGFTVSISSTSAATPSAARSLAASTAREQMVPVATRLTSGAPSGEKIRCARPATAVVPSGCRLAPSSVFVRTYAGRGAAASSRSTLASSALSAGQNTSTFGTPRMSDMSSSAMWLAPSMPLSHPADTPTSATGERIIPRFTRTWSYTRPVMNVA